MNTVPIVSELLLSSACAAAALANCPLVVHPDLRRPRRRRWCCSRPPHLPVPSFPSPLLPSSVFSSPSFVDRARALISSSKSHFPFFLSFRLRLSGCSTRRPHVDSHSDTGAAASLTEGRGRGQSDEGTTRARESTVAMAMARSTAHCGPVVRCVSLLRAVQPPSGRPFGPLAARTALRCASRQRSITTTSAHGQKESSARIPVVTTRLTGHRRFVGAGSPFSPLTSPARFAFVSMSSAQPSQPSPLSFCTPPRPLRHGRHRQSVAAAGGRRR